MSAPPEPAPPVWRRRSWLTLIAWAVALALLALLGRDISQRLAPMSLEVPGTPSSRAEATLGAKFGNTVPIAILLKGPPRAVDTQGPRMVDALRRLGHIQVLSPWDRSSAVRSLSPRPGAAFVLVNFIRPASASIEVVPSTEAVIAHTVRAPVHSYMTGVAVIGYALQKATLSDTERAETIALPVLVLVLLLVFRSPIAAAVPLVMGGATVMAGHGLLWLASFVTPINSLGVAIAAMMSLALGVDYALLMVSRVRQELAAGHEHQAAVTISVKAAGRTIVSAGGTLALTMLAASAVATPGLLGPVAIGVVISGLLSVALAVTAMPSVLRLLGPQLNRWEIRLPRASARRAPSRASRLLERLIARPVVTVPAILAGMLALASPAGALRLGPPDASELPASSAARHAVQMVQHTIGPGWSAPFVIVASARDGAITTPARLRALMRWQEAVAHTPGVATVLGPGSVAGARKELAQAHSALLSIPDRLQSAQRGIQSLRSGLGRASDGVMRLREGLASAASGAGSLSTGAKDAQTGAARLARETDRAHAGARRLARETDRAHAGAKQLQGGLKQAALGSAQLADGLDQAAAGAERLASSDRQLTAGAGQLAQGMDALDETVHAVLEPIQALARQLQAWTGWIASLQASNEQLQTRALQAMQQLEAMTVGRTDPRYELLSHDIAGVLEAVAHNDLSHLAGLREQLTACLQRLAGLPTQLSDLLMSLDRLRAGADRLASGTRESEEGAIALHSALAQLAAGGHTLNGGLAHLSSGAGQLSDGLGHLSQGNHALARGLGQLAGGNRRLAGGLGRLSNGNRRLAGGLRGLAAGGAELASGLASGADRTRGLSAGLGRAQGPLKDYAGMLGGYQQDYRLLRSESPNALDSGYLVLTALDGTVAPMREQVAQLVNVNGGGQAARIMVISASPPSAPATTALSATLRRSLPSLAAATGSDVQIGQGAQYLLDYKNANTARVPWLVLALAAVAMLTLVLVLRALLLPLIAVVLNLATIAVALGTLELLTSEHLLGGPGYIDAASGAGIMSIMFVLSIDYEVFLLTRMRERWIATRDSADAIQHGLRHTAGVITGSAAIMTAVFLAFAGAGVIPLRQFGVGLTVAVLLDATIVRLVLLPAIMRAAGPRIWWLPGALERRLPRFE